MGTEMGREPAPTVGADDFASFDDVYDAIVERVGAKLFTVLGFLDDARRMLRVYSNHPVEYPVGGEKDTAQDVAADWLSIAIVEQRPYFGSTPADVERIFRDSDLIASLGCGSIINVPVIDGGTTIGALNILDAEGAYDDESVVSAQEIAARCTTVVRSALRRPGTAPV